MVRLIDMTLTPCDLLTNGKLAPAEGHTPFLLMMTLPRPEHVAPIAWPYLIVTQ